MTAFVRWTLFILIGFPFQLLVLLIYPFVHLWFVLAIKRNLPRPYKYPEGGVENAGIEHEAIRDEWFAATMDDHGALKHYGYFMHNPEAGFKGLQLLVDDDGGFLRKWQPGKKNRSRVSGDVVATWCFAHSLVEIKTPNALRKMAKHYLKHLGCTSNDGWVSARVNNFGLNYCPDGWKGIGQPMAGPQFWCNSAVFAQAAKHLGGIWKLVFWLHFFLMGGPMWVFSPAIYFKKDKLGYVRDITARAIFAHVEAFGCVWWVMKPLRWIVYDIAEYEVALFYAMFGKMISPKLPEAIDAWHSQHHSGNMGSGKHCDIYTVEAIKKIQRSMRYKRGILHGRDYDDGLKPAGD
jgi:hypothetical protein